MQPIYVSKNLSAASSNGIGSISTAATPVVTVNTSQLDTGRRIVFYSTADASSMTLTFAGQSEGLTAISESVVGSTASGIAATTTLDFQSVTSVTASSNANIPFIIGTSSVGGTPWKVTNWHISPMSLGGTITFSTSANGMTARYDITMDDPSGAYPCPTHGSVPIVYNSTSHIGVACSTDSWGVLNADANTVVPITAWRLTLTSSSSGAGTVSGAVLQAGI